GSSADYFTAFKAAMSMPPASNTRERLAVLARIAEAVFGPDVVDDVLDAWDLLQRADTMKGMLRAGMSGPVMLRWLVRPLVPDQQVLTDEERSYWEPYIYQSRASQPEAYLDYLNMSGKPSPGHRWTETIGPCCGIDKVERVLLSAAKKLEQASDKTADTRAGEKLRHDALRIRAMRCLILTVRHTLQMASLIYERDQESQKTGKISPDIDMPHGSMGSHGLFFMHRTMRWELDNVYDLIELLETSPVPLLKTARNPEDENPLLLGPNVVEQLRNKARIMLKYWRTAEQGYYLPTKGG
ncbi:hypothetical protein ACFLSJ_06650, partial [Verrucomicrobiota bacterium]